MQPALRFDGTGQPHLQTLQPDQRSTAPLHRFPEAIFFECEPGLNHLEVFKVPTYNWDDFLAACKLLAQGNHPFKTIVVDTVDNAFKFCTEYVCAKHSIEYEGDMAHGKGWALVKNEWHRVLTRLASLPYGLILISHAVDKTVETRTGEYTKTQPSLPDRARGVVLGLVDMILYGDAVTRKDAAGNVTVESVLRSKPHPTYEAGDRTGRLPEVLPPRLRRLRQGVYFRCSRLSFRHPHCSGASEAGKHPEWKGEQMSEYDDSFAPESSGVDLSAFDDDFSSAEAPSFDEVPDGKYQARIDSVRLDRSQKGTRGCGMS